MLAMFGLGPTEIIVLVLVLGLMSAPLMVGVGAFMLLYRTKRGPIVCPHCGGKLRDP
jgi:hypothetical protein